MSKRIRLLYGRHTECACYYDYTFAMNNDAYLLEPMRPGDYDSVMALWSACEGVRVNETPDELARILERNPGMSCVVRQAGEIVGAVLCGHDGRRGYLYHLGVAVGHRRAGLGQQLVEHCLAELKRAGIRRCSIFLIVDNAAGEAFWRRNGWRERTDLKVLAKDL